MAKIPEVYHLVHRKEFYKNNYVHTTQKFWGFYDVCAYNS